MVFLLLLEGLSNFELVALIAPQKAGCNPTYLFRSNMAGILTRLNLEVGTDMRQLDSLALQGMGYSLLHQDKKGHGRTRSSKM